VSLQVKRLKQDRGVMVVALAVGPSWWIDVQQLHSVASYPTSRSVIVRRRVDDNDVELARLLHSRVCDGNTVNTAPGVHSKTESDRSNRSIGHISWTTLCPV